MRCALGYIGALLGAKIDYPQSIKALILLLDLYSEVDFNLIILLNRDS